MFDLELTPEALIGLSLIAAALLLGMAYVHGKRVEASAMLHSARISREVVVVDAAAREVQPAPAVEVVAK